MNNYFVLYRIESIMCPADAPFAFQCFADAADHADEQCINAYPDADIVWISDSDSVMGAYAEYWSLTEEETC